MKTRLPAECFPPVEFIREELDARGLDDTFLYPYLGKPRTEAVMAGERITPADADRLSQAFGTNAGFWMNLQLSYKKWKAQQRA